jgi:hypothetical protein
MRLSSTMTTVKPLPGIGQRFDVALMVLAFAYGVASLYGGVIELYKLVPAASHCHANSSASTIRLGSSLPIDLL